MKPVNPVSEKDRAEAKRLHNTITNRFFPSILDVEELAHTLADARAEGYVAGVEDAAKQCDICKGRGIINYVYSRGAARVTEPGECNRCKPIRALLGPKKEGGG